jgi:signal transduction histidine kinase
MAVPQSQERLRSALRVVLALSAFAIYFGDPSEHPGRRPFAVAVLFAFVAYSLAMYVLAVRQERYIPLRAAPWIDVGWVTLLVAVSAGTSSIFYPLYLFAIHYASFGGGFRIGMAVAVASVVSFAGVGVITAPRGPSFAIDPYFVRPLYLLVLGYLTAAWGGHEVRSRARLALLRDVTALSNPRFGIERTVARLLEAVRAFYDADSCRLVVAEERTGRRWMRSALRGGAGAVPEVSLPDELAGVLLPPAGVDAFHAQAARLRRGRGRLQVLDAAGAPPPPSAQEAAHALVDALDAGAVLSVPFRYHANALARLHVVRVAPAAPFDRSDVDFLRHVLEQLVPVLESIRLVDRLASDAADEERRRIARDLHDSVIQPYLGLRLGLSAVEKALSSGRTDEGRAHLARLVELADGEVETLRGYVGALREGSATPSGGRLEAGVRRFCSRFSDATGIRVDVAAEGPPVRNDRLAAEVFQMVAEGLSNVRRHTSATHAEVRIRSAQDRLLVTIANEAEPPGPAPFFPRSLGERAVALGGSVRVEPVASGNTAVHVEIPL